MLELRIAPRRIARFSSHFFADLARIAAVASLAGSVGCGRAPAPYVQSGAATAAPSFDVSPAADPPGKWVSAYYVGYHQSWYPPSAIAWNGLTHLFIARVVPNADGTLNTTFDVDVTKGPVLARTLVQLAHQHGKKAVVMLGGSGSHDGWVGAAGAQNRGDFVRNLIALAVDYGFDGFDLDWEPLEPGDHADFQALAQEIRAALPSTLLSVPVGWASINYPPVSSFYGDIAPLFDQINVMTYGMAGAWPGWQSWHSSALQGETPTTPTSVSSSVDAYLAAGVPAAKLGIGIATYGVCWSPPVTGPKATIDSGRIVADDNIMTFDHIMSLRDSPDCERWDPTSKASYLSFASPRGPEGCTFISYESPRSILEKGAYVKQRGLGGAIVWTVSQGYRPSLPAGHQNPLMDALAEAFLR